MELNLKKVNVYGYKHQVNMASKYQKFTQLEHILKRPDTYIGSLNQDIDKQWILNDDQTKMVRQNVTHVPGLYKIYDEILVNAIDQCVVDKTTDQIKIDIDEKNECITIMNSGMGVPIEKHEKHDIYIPEMIFGELLTSSNYDDSQERITGGRNGYGAKLTNVFSKRFVIDIINPESLQQYIQEWSENMSVKTKPKITKCSKTKGYVKVSFWPDLKRFGMKSLQDDDIIKLFIKRAYDCCACTPKNVKVYLNGKQLNIKSFEKYIDLYVGDKKERSRVLDESNDRWNICVTSSDGFNQVSFVNGINTYIGGSHVECIIAQLTKQIIEYIENKHKNLKVKPQYIKEHLFIFIKSTLVNPSFSSQTKSECTSRYKDFGSRYVVSEEFIKKVIKLGILDDIIALAKHKENRELNKSDGKKKSTIKIPKLDDAIKAGTSESEKCTLILTEGDSAKTFAISGLSVIGRQYFGVFPLRGKLLNVRDASVKQLTENEEINHLKQIIGLQQDKKYNSTSELRYGKIMILTDSDVDGSHIKGLIINFIHTFWPGLIKLENRTFLTSMKTPILKASKKSEILSFYTKQEYEEWRKKINNLTSWNIKYYKGLGTSTSNEAKEYFKTLDKCMIKYEYCEHTNDVLNLAFNKKKSDERKKWIQNYKSISGINELGNTQTYDEFINKDLIHFSVADVMRSIPNMVDGLKPSQRKVLYVCRKVAANKEYKVSQLSGIVSSQSMYHNGEQSLMGCIIGMAQNYIGSNNINVLEPKGQFGTRLMGGHDSASPRYIFTKLCDVTNKIYDAKDDAILNYLEDDGVSIEPEFFVPTIPMVLVNGVDGIGTGYSSKIPCYNPLDIINNVKRLSKGEKLLKMIPWYKGFKGNIEETSLGKYTTKGIYEVKDDKTLLVTELPIGKWTNDYKEYLDSLIDEKIISYENHCTETTIYFKIKCKDVSKLDIEKDLKLTTNLSTSNMHLFDENMVIKKYGSAEEILEDFYKVRFKKYVERREYLLKTLYAKQQDAEVKMRFIKLVINEKIKVFKRKKMDIIQDLTKHEFKTNVHDSLLEISLYQFTEEKYMEFKKQLEKSKVLYEQMKLETPYSMWERDINDIIH